MLKREEMIEKMKKAEEEKTYFTRIKNYNELSDKEIERLFKDF